MQKNLILAIALSFAVYLLWFAWVGKRYAPAPKTGPEVETAAKPGPKGPAPQERFASSDVRRTGPTEIPKTTSQWKAQAFEFKIPRASILIHPEGAGIISFVFKGPIGPVELVPNSRPGFFSTWPEATFKSASRDNTRATFETELPRGILVKKTFIWDEQGGINHMEISAENTSGEAAEIEEWEISLGPGIGTVKNQEKENKRLWKAVYAVEEKGRKHPSLKNLAKSKPSGPWLWAGVNNRYFLAAAIPEKWEPVELNFSKVPVEGGKAPFMSLPHPGVILEPGETLTWKINFYFGPKDYNRLTAFGHGLDRSVDFGFFSPIAKLANSALDYFYRMTGNYGWAIVILTIILQIILFPLTLKSTKATFAMKKLQPKMKLLQQKYKNDPKRLNTEMMQMYKSHGANPLGGCLPMLLQIPVFFALFTTLRNSWVLHGAPFIFWIHDLSSKDPYYVLPIVMGAVMFFQQSLNPQAGDPSQAKIMKWMPVLFTFMFLRFPSGLVLYWLTNSLLGFAQQFYMQKKMAEAEAGVSR